MATTTPTLTFSTTTTTATLTSTSAVTGSVSNVTVTSGEVLLLASGARATGVRVLGGGKLYLSGGATASGVAVNTLGTAVLAQSSNIGLNISGTGTLELASGNGGSAGLLSSSGMSGFAGTILVDAGANWAVTGNIGIAAGGTTVVPTISNAGTLSLAGTILSPIAGTGTVVIGANGAVDFQNKVGSGQLVQFASGSGTLELAAPSAFAGRIGQFGAGDTLKLDGFTATQIGTTVSGSKTILIVAGMGNGVNNYSFELAQTPANETFSYVNTGGNALVTDNLPGTYATGTPTTSFATYATTTTVGGSISNVTVTSGTELLLLPGAVASGVQVNNGAALFLDAGAAASGVSLQPSGTAVLAQAANVTLNAYGSGVVELAAGNGGSAGLLAARALSVFSGTIQVDSGANWGITGNIGVAAAGTTVVPTINNAGTLSLAGTILSPINGTGTVVLAQGAALDLQGAVGSGQVVQFAGSSGTLELAAPSVFAGQIGQFIAGDTLRLDGFTATQVGTTMVGANTYLLVVNSSGAYTFELANTPANETFSYSNSGGNAVITDNLPCYRAGTLIRTPGGDVAVEALRVGDPVLTAAGLARPVRWVGHNRVDCARFPDPAAVLPIRIAAHAFGPARPAHDLFVSPGHAICVTLDGAGEVLVPAGLLCNGGSVQQVAADQVSYWHVALDGHDILLAENLPAESYIDVGNAGFFVENGVVALSAGPDGRAGTLADYCRPFANDGPLVEQARQQLHACALQAGWTLCPAEAPPVLLAGGRRIAPETRGRSLHFTLPEGAGDGWLVSPAASPRDVSASPDRRVLGLDLAGIAVQDRAGAWSPVPLDHPLLCAGFYDPEDAGGIRHRWTAARALLPAALWQGAPGPAVLRIDLAGPPIPSWHPPQEQQTAAA